MAVQALDISSLH